MPIETVAPNPNVAGGTRRFALALAGLLALTFGLFYPLLNAQFVFWDDMVYVSTNPMIAQGLNATTIRWAFADNFLFFDGLLEYFSPLTALSRLADTSLFGAENAAAFHRTNLLLHLANVTLVACALRLLTRRTWLSLAAAAIFALHPFVVEPTGWLSARKDLVYGTTFLLTILAYACYARRPGWRGYLPLAMAFLLACLAKPMVVTLPCVLLLLDFWPLNRLTLPPRLREATYLRSLLRMVLEKLPMFLVSIGVALLAVKSQSGHHAIVPMNVFGWEDRLGNVVAGYVEYVSKFFVPLDFAPLHRFVEYANVWNTVPRLALLAGVCGLVFFYARRLPWLFTGWFWFVGILLPVSGIMQVGAARIAERYMYMPIIGLAVALVWGGDALHRRFAGKWPAVGPVLVGLYLGWMLLMALVAHRLTWIWRDNYALADRQLTIYPMSWNFHRAFAEWLTVSGQHDLAWAHLHEMIEANEYPANAWRRLSEIHLARGQGNLAVEAAEKAVSCEPNNLELHSILGMLLVREGRTAEAIPHLERADSGTGNLSPNGRFILLSVYLETGRKREAEVQFNKLLEAAKKDYKVMELLQSLKAK